MAELPNEIVERLSVHARVKVSLATGLTTEVPIAPLSRQLFLLVNAGGAFEASVLDDPLVTVTADGPDGDWSVRIRGRAVVGRSVLAEARRPELMHWLPEGVSPSGLMAVRFLPEHLEYYRGKGKDRTRVEGPVPGAAPPPLLTRYALLAAEGVVLGYFAIGALDFVGLLYLHEQQDERIFLLLLMVFTGCSLLAGANLVHQAARYQRWREGLEPSAEGGGLVSGWVSARHLQRVGWGMIGLGFLLAICLGGGAGWQVAAWAVISSGILLVGPFFLIRHLLRRRDAALEIG